MKKISITVKDVKEDGDKAVATYVMSDMPGKDQTINLVKKDNKWLVQFTKNDEAGAKNTDQTTGVDSTGPATPSADTAAADTSKH